MEDEAMKKDLFKRVTAIAMATVMVFGGAMTVMASSSGEQEGEGVSEGHVDRKATLVTLPTDATDTTFAYTMDPEQLIKETSHAKYGDEVIFPSADDTFVYFNRGTKGGEGADKDYIVYANESAELKVINQSSHKINLTVKAEAISDATDIALAEEADLATATDAALYLGLIVGSEEAAPVLKETAATTTIEVAGTPANFKVDATADKKGYEYRVLTLEEYKAIDGNAAKEALEWAETTFKLEGAVNHKDITATTTAPKVKVTWSWTDPAAAPVMTVTAGGVITITNLKEGQDVATVSIASSDSSIPATTATAQNFATFVKSSDGKTITVTLGQEWSAYLAGKAATFSVTIGDTTLSQTQTISIP